MRKLFIGLGALVVPAVIASFMASGCEAADKISEGACGECGLVAEGDIGISGNAKLDGFFKAVADLNSANVAINADFIANLGELETAFGITGSADLEVGARVTALVAKIKGEVTANVDGGIKVNYVPPKCSANLSVSVDAQAKCEAKAGCDVKVDPGKVSVTCEGSCTGGCTGECSGTAQCKVEVPNIECKGTCEGKCAVDVTAECTGTCKGTCDGECSVKDASGNCQGTCNGNCKGSCETNMQAECKGKCTGSCTASGTAAADCKGEVKCEGECKGSCSGGCTGTATPPSASADCNATADCEAQASAQASANLQCTPPQLSVGFALKATVDATASAKFGAKMEILKVKGAAMLAGFAKYKALIDGEVDGKVVFKTSPLAAVTASLEGVVSAGVKGNLFADIPAGRITCVIPAMEASVSMLGDIGTKAKTNLSAQAEFAKAFTSGFKN